MQPKRHHEAARREAVVALMIPMRPGRSHSATLSTPMHSCRLVQGIDNAKKTSKTGVPGAGGAPDSRGQDGLAPPRIKKLALSTKEFDPWGT